MKPDAPVNTHSPTYQMVHDEEERRLKGNWKTSTLPVYNKNIFIIYTNDILSTS